MAMGFKIDIPFNTFVITKILARLLNLSILGGVFSYNTSSVKLVSYWASYHIVPDLIGCVAKEEDLECANISII